MKDLPDRQIDGVTLLKDVRLSVIKTAISLIRYADTIEEAQSNLQTYLTDIESKE